MTRHLNVSLPAALRERLVTYVLKVGVTVDAAAAAAFTDYLNARSDGYGVPHSGCSPLPAALARRPRGRPRLGMKPWTDVLSEREAAMRRRAGRLPRVVVARSDRDGS